jgi:hypothetical protein
MKTFFQIRLLGLAALLWAAGPGAGRAEDELVPGLAVTLKNKARVIQIDASNASRYKGSTDMLALPGLVADRKRQCVEVLAESTGLSSNSIVEFLLISETSQHGYEAIGVSFAKPSDIHKALEFIGMRAGAPYNPQQLRMWPKGERVLINLLPQTPGSNATPLRLERLVLDRKSGRPLPDAGFIFTGSLMVDGEQGREYAADAWEPKAVVSIYNEPYAVFDIPRIAAKSAVYGDQVVNPECALGRGVLLSLRLEPEYKDGRKRVRDLVLEVAPGTALSDLEEGGAVYALCDPEGKALAKGRRLADARQVLADLVKQGEDPFVAVRFQPEMRLDKVRNVCRLISDLDDGNLLRVEPPGPGQLLYRAFLANEQWRKREQRAGQPWELVLPPKGPGKLIRVEEADDALMEAPVFKTTEFAVANAQDLARRLAEDAAARKQENKRPRLPVILVFAEPGAGYGELVEMLKPVLAENYVIYVFLG